MWVLRVYGKWGFLADFLPTSWSNANKEGGLVWLVPPIKWSPFCSMSNWIVVGGPWECGCNCLFSSRKFGTYYMSFACFLLTKQASSQIESVVIVAAQWPESFVIVAAQWPTTSWILELLEFLESFLCLWFICSLVNLTSKQSSDWILCHLLQHSDLQLQGSYWKFWNLSCPFDCSLEEGSSQRRTVATNEGSTVARRRY